MTTDAFVKGQLALLAWQEGNQDSHNLMVAIMLVQANRVLRENWHTGNWLEVIRLQRSGWSGWIQQHRQTMFGMYPDTRDPKFQAILTEVDTIYDGGQDLLTDGALWYVQQGSDFYDCDGWFQRNILESPPEKHPRAATIAGWTFFK
jgi:hypothetical protein